MIQTDQNALRRILLQQSAEDFRVFALPSREPLTKHKALALIETKAFVFKTNKAGTVVKWLQAIDTAPEALDLPAIPSRIARWIKCWRTSEAVLFYPSADYGR